tara:strand:+ start:1784 stop:2080 length:297 start_codon:yes stop_codon:yes gene_type:complete
MTDVGLAGFSLSELSLFVVSVMGACAGLLGAFFKGITRSRCSNVRICCGCLECVRKPPSVDELEAMNNVEDPPLEEPPEPKNSEEPKKQVSGAEVPRP